MSRTQPRKTSIPIHFYFAHSRRTDAPRSVSAPLRRKNYPPSNLIPNAELDPSDLSDSDLSSQTKVEFSNFSPRVRQPDLENLLRIHNITAEFRVPPTPSFARPFRATILVFNVSEARRAVKELNGKEVCGRKITVRMKRVTEKERREYRIQDMAEQSRTSIINTARVYHSSLADVALELRETIIDGSHFVFLQKLNPVTLHFAPEISAPATRNPSEWEFVAGAAVDVDTADREKVPRLEALRSLQENLETQGVLGEVWGRLEEY